MKNFKKITLFSLLSILFIPLLGMEKGNQPILTWVKSKNNDESISFTDNEKMLSNTLEYMTHGEEPSSQDNPFQLEVSYNTLNICKTIFSGLQTVSDIPEEEKVLNIANFFSQPHLNYDKDEFNFLDIPLVEKAFKLLSQQQGIPTSNKKRKREEEQKNAQAKELFKKQKEGFEEEEFVTIKTADDQQVIMPTRWLRLLPTLNNVAGDIEDSENIIYAPIFAQGLTILKDMFFAVEEAKEKIVFNLDEQCIERLACLEKEKKEELDKLDFLLTKQCDELYELYSKNSNIGQLISSSKLHVTPLPQSAFSPQKLQLTPLPQSAFSRGLEDSIKKLKNDAQEKKELLIKSFAVKEKSIKEQCIGLKNFNIKNFNIIKTVKQHFVSKELSFEEIMNLAMLGDFTGCSVLLKAAISLGRDHILANPRNGDYKFEELSHEIATIFNEKLQKTITKSIASNIKFLNGIGECSFSNDGRIVVQNTTGLNIVDLKRKTTREIFDYKQGDMRIIGGKEHALITATGHQSGFISMVKLYQFNTDGSGITMQVSFNDDPLRFYLCNYSFDTELITCLGETVSPSNNAKLLWHSSDQAVVFIEEKSRRHHITSLFFGKKEIAIRHGARVLPYCFTGDHRKLITCGINLCDQSRSDQDRESSMNYSLCRIWDTKTGDEIATLDYAIDNVHSIACSSDGEIFAILDEDLFIYVYNMKTKEMISCFNAYGAVEQPDDIDSFDITPNNQYIIIGGRKFRPPYTSGIKSIWDIKKGDNVFKNNNVYSILCQPDGSIIIRRSQEHKIVTDHILYDIQATQVALRNCSLDASLLMAKIINSKDYYVLSPEEKECYQVLPEVLKNIVNLHIAKE